MKILLVEKEIEQAIKEYFKSKYKLMVIKPQSNIQIIVDNTDDMGSVEVNAIVEIEDELKQKEEPVKYTVDIEEIEENKPVKRRGRPKKAQSTVLDNNEEKPVKKRRGRPPKKVEPEQTEEVEEDNLFDEMEDDVEDSEESNSIFS